MANFGFKRPRTTCEVRASLADHGVTHSLIRAKRNFNNLPNEYDDFPTSRRPRDDRYKNHRRTT